MQLDRNAGDDGIYSSVTKRDNSDYHQIGSAVANEYWEFQQKWTTLKKHKNTLIITIFLPPPSLKHNKHERKQ